MPCIECDAMPCMRRQIVARCSFLFAIPRLSSFSRLFAILFQFQVPGPLFFSPLFHLFNRVFGQLLPEQSLAHSLFSRAMVSDRYQDAAHNVACDTAAQYRSRERKGTDFVIDAPCTSAQCDL